MSTGPCLCVRVCGVRPDSRVQGAAVAAQGAADGRRTHAPSV